MQSKEVGVKWMAAFSQRMAPGVTMLPKVSQTRRPGSA